MKCPKCKKNYNVENRKLRKLECGHYLCAECVETSEKRTYKCTYCQAENDLDIRVISNVEELKVPSKPQSADNFDSKLSLFTLLNRSLQADGFIQQNELIVGVEDGVKCHECANIDKKTNMKICKTCYKSDTFENLKKFAICTICCCLRHFPHQNQPFVKEYARQRLKIACLNDPLLPLMFETFGRIVKISDNFGKDTNLEYQFFTGNATACSRFKAYMISLGLLENSIWDEEDNNTTNFKNLFNATFYPDILENMKNGIHKGISSYKNTILMQLKGQRMCTMCGDVNDILKTNLIASRENEKDPVYLNFYCLKCVPKGVLANNPASHNLLRTQPKVIDKYFGKYKQILGDLRFDAIAEAAEIVKNVRLFGPFDVSTTSAQPTYVDKMQLLWRVVREVEFMYPTVSRNRGKIMKLADALGSETEIKNVVPKFAEAIKMKRALMSF